MCVAPSGPANRGHCDPGLRFACPGLWNLTPLGSQTPNNPAKGRAGPRRSSRRRKFLRAWRSSTTRESGQVVCRPRRLTPRAVRHDEGEIRQAPAPVPRVVAAPNVTGKTVLAVTRVSQRPYMTVRKNNGDPPESLSTVRKNNGDPPESLSTVKNGRGESPESLSTVTSGHGDSRIAAKTALTVILFLPTSCGTVRKTNGWPPQPWFGQKANKGGASPLLNHSAVFLRPGAAPRPRTCPNRSRNA